MASPRNLCSVCCVSILSLVVLSLPLVVASASSENGYQVTKKIGIPGQGGWDYLTIDEAARRLYVSHGTQVEVLDVDSGSVVGKIPYTLGVHGIAVAPELGRGFVSNGQSSTVTVFDLKTSNRSPKCRWGRSRMLSFTTLRRPASSRQAVVATVPALSVPPTPKSLAQSIWAEDRSSPWPMALATCSITRKMRAGL
jgi:hypothetical protein